MLTSFELQSSTSARDRQCNSKEEETIEHKTVQLCLSASEDTQASNHRVTHVISDHEQASPLCSTLWSMREGLTKIDMLLAVLRWKLYQLGVGDSSGWSYSYFLDKTFSDLVFPCIWMKLLGQFWNLVLKTRLLFPSSFDEIFLPLIISLYHHSIDCELQVFGSVKGRQCKHREEEADWELQDFGSETHGAHDYQTLPLCSPQTWIAWEQQDSGHTQGCHEKVKRVMSWVFSARPLCSTPWSRWWLMIIS